MLNRLVTSVGKIEMTRHEWYISTRRIVVFLMPTPVNLPDVHWDWTFDPFGEHKLEFPVSFWLLSNWIDNGSSNTQWNMKESKRVLTRISIHSSNRTTTITMFVLVCTLVSTCLEVFKEFDQIFSSNPFFWFSCTKRRNFYFGLYQR